MNIDKNKKRTEATVCGRMANVPAVWLMAQFPTRY